MLRREYILSIISRYPIDKIIGINSTTIISIITILALTLTIGIIIWVKSGEKIFIGFDGIKPVYIDISGNKHIVIFGMTGSGKTETAKRILKGSKKGKLIIDWSGEYLDYKSVEPSELKINLKQEDVIDAIISTFQLTIPQQTLLIEAVKRGGGSLRDVINDVKEIECESDSGREVRDALLRRLSILEKLNLFNGSRDLMEVEAVDLSKMAFEAKKLASNIILKSFYNNPKPRILVIEEAQNIMPRNQNPDSINTLELIINELRKHGVNVILIAQTPSQISTVYRNAEYIILHKMRLTHYEIQELGLKPEDAEAISKLDVGECIILSGGSKRKVKVKTVKREIEKVVKVMETTNCKEDIKVEESGNENNSSSERKWDYDDIMIKLMEIEGNYKKLMDRIRGIESVKITENPIKLGEFIDRTEDNIRKTNLAVNILKDKLTLMEEELEKKIIEAKQINGKIEKLEKQTAMNTNKIIELEKRITDIIMKMRDFEEWVKEALSKIEYKQ
ncbi:MAG: DUF87 domain-containing protein [archaeon YNP-WB-040]|nr:DUF87 domain-containing protein [Candidatus Culexarchaeum yellowstonense]